MNNLKIVIIAQCIYPSLLPRAHRATQLATELAKRGHEVIVYALLGNYDYTDFSKETNLQIKNLGTSKFGCLSSDGIEKNNILYKIIRKIIGKYISFPEGEIIPMIKEVLSKEKKIDLLITIAKPYEIHWGTALCKNKDVKCWISDCGDPFMGNPFSKPPFYFKNIEKYWCRRTDYITVPIEEAKKAYYEEFQNKIRVIPQGFDFSNVKLADYIPNNIPTFAYSGIVYKNLRDPTTFMEYLCSLDHEFKFIVYTKSTFFDNYKSRLEEKIDIRDYIPREKLLYELSKMDFLINFQNNSGVQQPSKLIDYALTGRPIINISNDFKERENFDLFMKGDYSNSYKINNLEDYNIKNVAEQFLKLYIEKINNRK